MIPLISSSDAGIEMRGQTQVCQSPTENDSKHVYGFAFSHGFCVFFMCPISMR